MLRVLNLQRLRHVRLSSTATIPSSDNAVHKSNFTAIQQLIDEDIIKSNPVPVFKRALIHSKATALKDVNGEFTYADLVTSSKKLSTQISEICGMFKSRIITRNSSTFISDLLRLDLSSLTGTASRITYLCPNDVTSVISQWATWISGSTAVPLSVSHPSELLEYFIKDSKSNLIITTPELEERLKPFIGKLDVPVMTINRQNLTEASLVNADEDSLAAGFLSGEFYKKSLAMVCFITRYLLL